jgi:hypothetical protein
MAWPPEAAASFITTKGANRLWPERLSSSTFSTLPLEPLLEELEDEELDELELLLDGQMEPPPLEEEEELGPPLPGIVTVVELARLKPISLKAATLMV